MSGAVEMLQSNGAGEGEVSIIAWAGLHRARRERRDDRLGDAASKKDTGCKVNGEDRGHVGRNGRRLMNGGGFDLVTASGDASLRLVAGGKRVQPINICPHPVLFDNVDERLARARRGTRSTACNIGVPYQWGAERPGLQHQGTFPEAPTGAGRSCSRNMNLPDGKSNKGRVQAYDGPIYIADAALYLMTKKPELGIKDPYELNEDAVQGGARPAARAA